jgi:hypothetical protein
MASSSRKKTTMAKLNREAAVRERRARKRAKKDARKLAAIEGPVEASVIASEEGSVTDEDRESETAESDVRDV